jgi:hypothetical protein
MPMPFTRNRKVLQDLFRKALQQRTTLVTRGYTALLGKADRRLPESFFLGLLEGHFSAAEAPAARHGDRLGTEIASTPCVRTPGSAPERPRAAAA